MDNDIFVYYVKFPSTNIHEAVLPCSDGYCVYLDERLGYEQQIEAYNHAVQHIQNGDFDKYDVDRIEYDAHRN